VRLPTVTDDLDADLRGLMVVTGLIAARDPNDPQRKPLRRRLNEAVLALPAGGVDRAWDADLLTVGQYHAARSLRRQRGLPD
jgi:hypothetical protein